MRTPSARIAPVATLALLLLGPAAAAAAPADPDAAALGRLAVRFAREEAAARTAAFRRLAESPDPLAAALRADPALALRRLDARGLPRYVALDNVDAARTVATDAVAPGGVAGLLLDGRDTPVGQLGLWDGGAVRTSHQELAGRTVQRDLPKATSFHATHVAGTMVAAGVDPAARGMAPAAPLDCWDWDSDLAEMAAAAAAGLRVSNHSYSPSAGWRSSWGQWYWHGDVGISATEDYGFGFYGEDARALDEIAHGAPGYVIVASAGNNRIERGPGTGGDHAIWNGVEWEPSTATRDPDGGATGYDTIPWSKNAKNVLVVGAVDDVPGGYAGSGSVTMTTFSGWGPTDDGRIKPDLVANGVSLWSCTDSHDSSRHWSSGTSMASPGVAGSVDLLIDHWRSLFGVDPRAATVKAIVFQTADECGDAEGPDYRFGWGLLNTRRAAELVGEAAADTAGARIVEAELAWGHVDTYQFDLAEAGDVRVTMHWTDVPGASPAPALDPTDPMLVNDLDLRLSNGVATWEPWVLDPASPAAPATRGDNVLDNTEQILAASLAAGSYTLSVRHEGDLEGGAQEYSLASSVPLRDASAPLTSVRPVPAASFAPASPNPFARGTTIAFTLPERVPVTAAVWDVRGRRVRTLASGDLHDAGPHRIAWDGRHDDGRAAASGVYFARLTAGSGRQVQKLVLVRPR